MLTTRKYEKSYKSISDAKSKLLKKLSQLSGVNEKEVESKISKLFRKSDILEIIASVEEEVKKGNCKFGSVKFDMLFNDKAFAFLSDAKFKANLDEYIEKYNELLNNSQYFKPGFDHLNATNINLIP